jgi:chromosome partitioning protein
MRQILASETLGTLGDDLDTALRQQESRLYSPDSRKSDRALRRFTIREMSDLCLRMKYNTLRHYLKNMEGLPEGQLESGNRRTFSLEEIHEIQEKLYQAGKIPDELYPGKLTGDETAKILVFNIKGGSSKTTSAVANAQLFAARGFKVLLVDMDPQASCSELFDIHADLDRIPSLYDVVTDQEEDRISITDAIQATYFPNIDIVPGSVSLTEFEYETAAAALSGKPFYSKIKDALSIVEDAYDIIIMDSPPHMSFCVIAALYASNSLLIPLSASMLDVASLVKFLQIAEGTMKSIEDKGGSHFDFIRILLTRYSPNDPAQLQLSSFLRNTLGSAILKTEFLNSTAISDAGNTMNPILEVDPSTFTRKTYDRIMESVQGIALELEEEIMIGRGRIHKDQEAA